MEPAARRVQSLVITILGFFTVGILLSFLFGLPYQFGGSGDPDNIGSDVFLRGTALAAPIVTLVIFAILGLMAPREDSAGKFGLIGTAVMGCLFIVGAAGELAGADAFSGFDKGLVFLWSVIGMILSVAVVLMALVALTRRPKTPVPEEDQPPPPQ